MKTGLFIVIPVFTPLNFYHTIYVDAILAYILYYCIYYIFTKYDTADGIANNNHIKPLIYDNLVMILALTVLSLTKSIAVVFVAMVIAGYVLKCLIVDYRRLFYYSWISMLIFPAAIWIFVNRYISSYVDVSGGQSLGGVSWNKIVGIILHNSVVTMQKEFEVKYFTALCLRPILGHIPYAVWAIVLTAFSIASCKVLHDKKLLVSGLWIMIVTVGYAAIMWITYLMSFTGYESSRLASFERYMSIILLACILLVVSICLRYVHVNSVNIVWMGIVVSILVISSIAHHYDDVAPGFLRKDFQRTHWENIGMADAITELTPDAEDTQVFVLDCGSNGGNMARIGYYSLPRSVSGGSMGPARYDGDVWSVNLTPDEFVNQLSNYDYFYVYNLDEIFIDNYSDAFEDSTQLDNMKIYSIQIINSKIHLVNL